MNNDTVMEMIAGRGGQQRSKITALIGNTTHNTEMYGYISVYMRLKGVVPPTATTRCRITAAGSMGPMP